VGDTRATISGSQRHPEHIGVLAIVAEILLEEMEVARDDLRQIVEVVGHSAYQLTDGLHFLGMSAFLFELFTLDFVHHHDLGVSFFRNELGRKMSPAERSVATQELRLETATAIPYLIGAEPRI
jgi:hypothetical protein